MIVYRALPQTVLTVFIPLHYDQARYLHGSIRFSSAKVFYIKKGKEMVIRALEYMVLCKSFNRVRISDNASAMRLRPRAETSGVECHCGDDIGS